MIERPLIEGTITARKLSESAATAAGYEWNARCTGYQLEGTGDDAEESIYDLIAQIRSIHSKHTMILKNPDKLEIDYEIVKVTATLKIGDNPNSTLADFMPEATAVPDEPSISDDGVEEGLPHVPDVQLVAGCNICSKYASGDCGGNNTNEPCKRYKAFEYAGETCETCRYFHNEKYCAKYHAVTEPDHYACVGYLDEPVQIPGVKGEEEKKDIPQDAAERCNSCGNCCDERDGNVRCFWHQDFFKPDSIEECDKYITREEAEKVTPCVWFGTQETPCDSCPYYGKSCKGTDYDKSCCDMFPPCVGCRHNKGAKYNGVVGDAYEYVVMCEDKLKPVNNQMRINDCRGWHSKDMEGKK